MEFAPTILTELFESEDDKLDVQEAIFNSAVINEDGRLIPHTILMKHEDYPNDEALVDVEGRAWVLRPMAIERMEFTCAQGLVPVGRAFNTFRHGDKWARKLRYGDQVELAPFGMKATVLGASCLRGEQAMAQVLENLTTIGLQEKYGVEEQAALTGFFKEIRGIYGADPLNNPKSEWSVIWLYVEKDA